MDRDINGRFIKGHKSFTPKHHIHSQETKDKIRDTLLQKGIKPKSVYKGMIFTLAHREKLSKARLGKNCGAKNNLWKGGISRAYKTGYYSTRYKKWRMAVFIRDNFTCQDCGKKNIYTTAHHIKSWKNYPELRFSIDNGQTLCQEYHSKTDNYKTKALLEFK